MNRTTIEWTNWSANPLKMQMPDGKLINACAKISPGCASCYAESYVRRFWRKAWGSFPGYTKALLQIGKPHLVMEELRDVVKLDAKIAAGDADPAQNKVFWNDMTDEFLEFWPDSFRDNLFAARALTPNLVHQVLTKRADRMLAYFTVPEPGFRPRSAQVANFIGRVIDGGKHSGRYWTVEDGYLRDRIESEAHWPLPNVHLGVSVENQKCADERINDLLDTPAAVRFLSLEPLLENVNFARILIDRKLSNPPRSFAREDFVVPEWVDWAIIGCESGSKRRPMPEGAAEFIIQQCRGGGIAPFMKQMEVDGKVTGDITKFPKRLQVREYPQREVVSA